MATYAELMRQRDAAVKIVNQIEEEMAEMENELFSVCLLYTSDAADE